MFSVDLALRLYTFLPFISLAHSVIYLYIQFQKNLFSKALKYCVAIPTYCTSGRQASKYFCKKRPYIYLRISIWWWDDGPGGDSDIGDSIILSFVPGQVNVCPFLKKKWILKCNTLFLPVSAPQLDICGQLRPLGEYQVVYWGTSNSKIAWTNSLTYWVTVTNGYFINNSQDYRNVGEFQYNGKNIKIYLKV